MDRPRRIGWIFALCWLAGCASGAGRPSFDASAYASMDCNQLNAAVAELSADISRAAIERGKVAKPGVLDWVPGGVRVETVVVGRQSTKIAGAQDRLRTIAAARDRACGQR